MEGARALWGHGVVVKRWDGVALVRPALGDGSRDAGV